MRVITLVLLVVTVTGCASSRRAEVVPPPVTLAEVNQALDEQRATVTYADGRQVEAFVFIGPETSVVREDRAVATEDGSRIGEVVVPTSEILRVEVDASLSAWQGAGRGAAVGAVPGGVLLLVGAASLRRCPDYCIVEGLAIGGGGVLAVLGAGVGAGVGATATSSTDLVQVYQSPVTRYPDAALALLGAPLAVPLAPEAEE